MITTISSKNRIINRTISVIKVMDFHQVGKCHLLGLLEAEFFFQAFLVTVESIKKPTRLAIFQINLKQKNLIPGSTGLLLFF